MRMAKLREFLLSWDAGAWGEPSLDGSGVSVLRSTNFRELGSLSFENQALLSIDEKTLSKKRLCNGDLLLERSGGGPLQPVGRVAGFWRSDEDDRFICGNFISRLVPNRETVDPLYLMYVLLYWHLSGKTQQFQTATTGIRNLQMKQYLDIELTIPRCVDEQRQIATRLKAQLAEVEKARQASEIQWEEVHKLKSKALEAVFSSVSNWQPLGVAARVQSGYAFKSESFKRSGTRLLRNANILPGKVYWDDTVYLSEDDAENHPNYVLQAGDVLISLDRPVISSGVKVARVQSSDLPALLLQRVGRFVLDPDKLDAGYLYAYLQTERFIAQISGHEQSLGVPHISPSQVASVLMPLPDLTIQKEMATRLSQITEVWSNAVQAIRKQRKDLAALPQRLLAQAFNHREET